MNEETAINSDLRDEILKYLAQTTSEPTPQFPTEYSALMYVALGTLRLIHESATNYSMWAIAQNKEPVSLHYPGALQEIITLLEVMAPQMASQLEAGEVEEDIGQILTGKFRL